MSESVRHRVYLGLIALVALAVVYGIVSDEQAAAWVAVVSALLGNGLAAVNTKGRSE